MKKNFRYYLLLMGCLFSMLSLSSLSRCDKEEDAPLQLDIIENTSDETRMYYNAQPPTIFGGIRVKEYSIHTGFDESVLKLQCTNCRNIRIEVTQSKPWVDEEHGYSTSTEATPEETGIYISVTDNNVLDIHFKYLDPYDNSFGYYANVKVFGKIDGVDKYTEVFISRHSPLLLENLNKDE